MDRTAVPGSLPDAVKPAAVTQRPQRRRAAWRLGIILLALLLTAAPLLAQVPAQIGWPRDLYNPSPRPDDVLLPLPCGGAMAFRWVQAEGKAPAGVESALAPLFRLVGPFAHEGRHDLLVGKYEVTRLQYETLPAMSGGPCPKVGEGGRMVQGGVGWVDALGFALHWTRWLAEQTDALPDCARAATLCVPREAGRPVLVRLPTEAEWEYAARGGLVVTPVQFGQPLYPMDGGLEHHVWYARNSDQQLKPIGQRAANPLGLHDLYGNVEELTLELYRSELFPGQPGAAVIRGGSVHTGREGLGAAQRNETWWYGHGGANRAPDNGFRLVADLSAPPGGAGVVQVVALPAPPGAVTAVAAAVGQTQQNVDTPKEVQSDASTVGDAEPGVAVGVPGARVGEPTVPAASEVAAKAADPSTGAAATVTAEATGQVRVSVNVPAQVRIDGRGVGQASPGTPLDVTALSAGEHLVEVTAEGYKPVSEHQSVVASRSLELALVMVPGKTPAGPPEVRTEAARAAHTSITEFFRWIRGTNEGMTFLFMLLWLGWLAFTKLATWVLHQRHPSQYEAVADIEYFLAAAIHITEGLFKRQLTAETRADMRPRVDSTINIASPMPVARTYEFEPEMIALPGGEYWMGSPEDEPDRSSNEGPRHKVRTRSFAIGKTAVTCAQYAVFARATQRSFWPESENPVNNVNWEDAVAYAAWLSSRTGKRYRLPSEAEWEYAARAGTETPFWTGRYIRADQAHYYDYNGGGAATRVYRPRVVPVGSLPANPWGLHEVSGNVWEWVQDIYHGSYNGAPADGSAWESRYGSVPASRAESWFEIALEDVGLLAPKRVVRGGGGSSFAREIRSANRKGWKAWDWGSQGSCGFRLAMTLTETPERPTGPLSTTPDEVRGGSANAADRGSAQTMATSVPPSVPARPAVAASGTLAPTLIVPGH